MKILNWLLKQIFYFRYFVLKQGKATDPNVFILPYMEPSKATFYSKSFTDGQWLERLPWYDPIEWPFQDWNTYGGFKQMYGKFYFKARLDGLGTNMCWPAIWLLEISDDYYFEIDIELFRTHFSFTIWTNHNGPQEGVTKLRANFGSHKLYRRLQKDFHLFLIDWSEEWIKFSINGILCARFPNTIHVPMQIIMSHLEMQKTIVK